MFARPFLSLPSSLPDPVRRRKSTSAGPVEVINFHSLKFRLFSLLYNGQCKAASASKYRQTPSPAFPLPVATDHNVWAAVSRICSRSNQNVHQQSRQIHD